MKIYDREGAPNTARIRIVLAEKALEHQVVFVSVDLIAAEQKQSDFLAKNPLGKIPLLELDDGLIIGIDRDHRVPRQLGWQALAYRQDAA
jgi:glutathione S-transferase